MQRTPFPHPQPSRKAFIGSLLFLCFSLQAQAQIEVRTGLQWLSFVRGAEVETSAANPGNQLLQIPRLELKSEFRPSLKLNLVPGFTFVARPILRAAGQIVRKNNQNSQESFSTSGFFNELYGSATFAAEEAVSVSYGIQNIQWGPAEFSSPSNPFFREPISDRDTFLLTRGKLLWRANLNAGKQLALTLLGDTEGAQESKLAAKLEASTVSGGSTIAVVAAARAHSHPFFGAFAQTELFSGATLYFDLAAIGTGAPGTSFTLDTLFGMRYAFERGTDVRVEWDLQNADWAKRELKKPGANSNGRYLYISVREPQISLFQTSEIILRAITSLKDSSVRGTAQIESSLNDSAQVFLATSVSAGKAEAEFTRETRWSATVGHRLSW